MDIAIAIGGALLAPAFKSLFNKLGSQDLLNYARKRRVLTQINKWKEMLERIDGVLEDAEEKQMESRSVKMWVSDLRKLAYDLEDILDEFDFEARRSKLKAKPMTGSSRVRKLTPNIRAVKFNKKLISKIKATTPRLEEITSRRNELDLSERPVKLWERIPATCLVNHAEIYGREKDKKAILELLNSESTDGRVALISIIGLGGIGKTTLGQLIFNEAGKKFDLTAWVSVGEDFDVNGAKESRIIVTTRNLGVSRTIGAIQSYTLRVLENDDCLSVFAHHALGVTNFEEHLDLEAIGKKIVERCQGLPLAAKAIGGLLRGQSTRDAWEQVLNSRIWEEKSDILPALKLSYHHLPSHLKQCFAYCAIFPKDYEFDEDELVLHWMAEGFLQHAQEMKQMKRWGHRYFHDLLWRSFFQQSTYNESRYVMHDLLKDLAKSVSGEICLHLDDDELKGIKSHANVRHSAFACHECDRYQRFEDFYEMSNLRTFFALSTDQWRDNFLSIRVVHDLVPKLKRLRVLSLAHYSFEEFPSSIGALKHLRYLDLSYNSEIKRLPNSLSDLQNLQTLKLCSCENLIELPTGIGALINLAHLDLEFTHALQEMPLGVANLTNLQTLSKFIVGKGSNCLGIRELMNLPHLEGQLSIEKLQNVARIADANLVDLKKIENLGDLALVWTRKLRDSPCEEDHEFQVLNLLEPHQKLERLSVRFYGGKEFPLWIGDPAFTNMVALNLWDCQNITSLPPLGRLCKLKWLSIKGMDELLEVGLELSPSLEILEIEDMLKLKQWAHSDDVNVEVTRKFPRLRKIWIGNCPKLVVTLPTSLPSLDELYIGRCQDIILESVHDLCSLQTLSICSISALENLHQVVAQSFVALKHLWIRDCSQLIHLWRGSTNLDKLSSLKSLQIEGCQKLVSLVGGEEGNLPCNLEILVIRECDGLEILPNGLQTLTSLREMNIQRCRNLVSFPSAGLPCSLKSLQIHYCDSLESLPKGIVHDSNARNEMSHLEVVGVNSCPSLTSVLVGEFPYSIKKIAICFWTTQLLESFHNRFSHLTTLIIYGSELESFPESGLAIPNLRDLIIRKCENLRLLPNQIQNLTSLLKLAITNCAGLVSFSDEGLPPNLTYLFIWSCENLRFLPNQMQNLTSLQRLLVSNCGGLVSFPDGGLPPKLGSLTISRCKKLKQPMSEWILNRLTSLTIRGPCPSTDMDSFPEEKGLLLPSSLTSLKIEDFKNLKSISRGIHHLTSLDTLVIRKCPKLQSFPKEGLPSTLERLAIFECPLLERRCRKEKGDYWRFIANIPYHKIK
ncbi:hypothetical protein JCGZ_16874 [Jatropha curcas]|uniref:NB-ARC domain-containing protein n=1 Tax=Jatropha curcas TaxID=180498 RepID=A0A067L582_JATCU|nr:hypothetical protein JCGZ_16874 [Jatropha curcas]